MTLAARLSASARRMVGHFGHTERLVLKRITTGALGATRSATTTVATSTVACSVPTPYGARTIDGARVQDGDLRVTLWADDPALRFDPAPEMVAELAGDTWRVVAVQKMPGAWELQLRGGGS